MKHDTPSGRQISERDELLRGLLAAAAELLLEPQIFTVSGDEIRGQLALMGGGVETGAVRHRRLSMKNLSIISRCAQDGIPYIGPVPDTDPCVNLCSPQLLQQHGVFVVPIAIGGRTICILVGHPRASVTRELRDAVTEMGREVSLELGKLIARRKEDLQSGEAGGRSGHEIVVGRARIVGEPAPRKTNPYNLAISIPDLKRQRPGSRPAPVAVPKEPVAVPKEPVAVPKEPVAVPEEEVILLVRPKPKAAAEPPAANCSPVERVGGADNCSPVVGGADNCSPVGRVGGAVKPTPAERRRAPRSSVRVQVTHVSDHNFFTGFMEDLSEGGLFIATYNLFEIGDRFELEFALPGQEVPWVVPCEVRWVRLADASAELIPGMGVKFLELAPRIRDKIQQFMRQRPPMFYDD